MTKLVINTATGESEVLPFSPSDKIANDKIEAAYQAQLLNKPMEEWKARMASFVMTRVEEEVISNLTADQKAALPQYTRDQHAAKLVARGEKP